MPCTELSPQSAPTRSRPDTTGLNFYRADPSLADLLQLYLPDKLFSHIEPHLERLGALGGDHLDQWRAARPDRHTPVLHHRDKFGRDEQWIEYHPAYRELERVAYGEFGIHGCRTARGYSLARYLSVRRQHAFTYLFNQAEFGLGCPINVTDGAAMLLSRFGDDALKAKYLDGLTHTDMALADPGRAVHDREGGRLGRRQVDDCRDARGRSLAPHWREMVLLERRCFRS